MARRGCEHVALESHRRTSSKPDLPHYFTFDELFHGIIKASMEVNVYLHTSVFTSMDVYFTPMKVAFTSR